jgi:HK97 family phage major capsid protein
METEHIKQLFKEELAAVRDQILKEEGQKRAELEARLEELSKEREILSRRAAIYGGEMTHEQMSPADRRERAVQQAGNHIRALALAKGNLRDAAEIVERRFKDRATAEFIRAGLTEGNPTASGNLVETQYADDIIPILYAQAVVRAMGATVLPMPGGNLTIHRLSGGSTATYTGEVTDIPATNPTTDTVQLSAKKLTALVPISNELLADTTGRVNRLVVDNLGRQLSLKEDIQFLRGTGSATAPNSILGLIPGGQVYDLAPAGSLAAALQTLRAAIRRSSAPMTQVGWVMNADAESLFYNKLSSTGQYVYRDEMNQGKLLGFPYMVANQLPSNIAVASGPLSGKTDVTEIYFGAWDQAIIADTFEPRIENSTEASYWNGSAYVSAFSTDQTLIRAIARHDFNLQHTAPFALARISVGSAT